ncbi:EboA domain-containing protein [Streptomyces sp. NPDC002328]|uniref:EboA domain-containing protein n=1 Tax=Streptomyces sp. NPDC002328 TaxID=3364642 RepID=UPI00368AFD61
MTHPDRPTAPGAAPPTPTEPAAPAPAPLTPTPLTPSTHLASLRTHLESHLPASARDWFLRALDEAGAHPGVHGPISVWELRLAEAGRRCGGAYADAVRVLVLHAAGADPAALTRVYSQGTADERRAVLLALPHLVPGPDALPLVEDALRTNDTRLLAAAVGPYAARHLGAHAWRHAVLKCLFTGVPVDEVAGLAQRARADAELARMLGDFAAERTAANRPVPGDLHRVLTLTLTPTGAAGTGSAPADEAAVPAEPAEPADPADPADPAAVPAGAAPRGPHPHGKES